MESRLVPYGFQPLFTYSLHTQPHGFNVDCSKTKKKRIIMNLDWKWVGIGILIMLGLSILAGIIAAIFLGSQLEGVTSPEDISLSSSQMTLIAILNFLAFVIGGYIVGIKSAGKTILEPAIAAAISVAIGLLLSGNFNIAYLLASGFIPFLAGLLGGWLGEKKQDARANS